MNNHNQGGRHEKDRRLSFSDRHAARQLARLRATPEDKQGLDSELGEAASEDGQGILDARLFGAQELSSGDPHLDALARSVWGQRG